MVIHRLKFYEIFRYSMIVLAGLIIVFIAKGHIDSINEESNTLVEDTLRGQINQCNTYLKKYLDNEVQFLQNVGDGVYGKEFRTLKDFQQYMNILIDGELFESLSYIDNKGWRYLEDGTSVDVRDKTYYYEAIRGRRIFLKYPDDKKEEDVEGISMTVPIYDNNKDVLGFLYAEKDSAEVRKDLEGSFDEYVGFSYVIDENGYVVFKAKNNYVDEESLNFYHYMIYNEVDLDTYVETVKECVSTGESKILRVNNRYGSGYLGVAPVSEDTKWTIVSYFGKNKISEYGTTISNKTVKLMLHTSFIIVLIFTYIIAVEFVKNRQIKKVAYTDPLTNIGNRFKFEASCKKILRACPNEKYVVAQFDIKGFKYINHKYGFNFGDKLLRIIAKELEKEMKKNEVCARVSNDIFIILIKLSSGEKDNVYKRIESVLRCTKLNNMVLSFRMGIYIIEDNKEDVSNIIEKSTFAWNHIRNSNKKNVNYYDKKLLNQMMQEERLEAKMVKALEDGEFKVFIQPKVDLVTDEICGGEALIRWISPEYGCLPPNSFIPLFEKNGFISNIDFYVLEQICLKTMSIDKMGLKNFAISVNQSRETLIDPDYLKKLEAIIDKYNIDTSLVELEITESVFVEDYDEILEVINRIKDLGFKISMDDFGSGYSSLNLLKEIPINILKIDRIFLRESKTSLKSKIIIRSVIQMAQNLSINVICEGVETIEQVNLLKEINCEMAQGYYYGRPMPMEEFDKVLFKYSKEN